jgi:GT2 family glycosyltransferase
LIVDNASADGSANEILAGYPMVELLQLQENRGYAAGMNAGIRAFPDVNAVALLTHDCVLAERTLERLNARLEADQTVGLVGPLLGWRSNPVRLFSGGGCLVGRSLYPRHRSQNHLVSEPNDPSPKTVEWLDGACLVVRRKVFDAVGLLDEGYFMYFEDVEYAVRTRRAGWRVELVPMAFALQQAGSWPRALWVRNHLRFLWRNASKDVFMRRVAIELREILRRATSVHAKRRNSAYLIARGVLAPVLRTDPKRLYGLGRHDQGA